MAIQGIADRNVKENFQRLNRLFNEEFSLNFGSLTFQLQNFQSPSPLWTIHWHKVGRQITLHFDGDQYVSSKLTANAPTLVGLPSALRPRSLVKFPFEGLNGLNTQPGLIYVGTDGSLQWVALGNWTAGFACQLYAPAISYLGV